MSGRHILYLVLFCLAVGIQWPLWFGKGGVMRLQELQGELTSINEANEKQRQANETVAAEIESLNTGGSAVEERARLRLGLIRSDEVLFRFVPQGSAQAAKASLPDIFKPTAKREYFKPKNADLYHPPGAKRPNPSSSR